MFPDARNCQTYDSSLYVARPTIESAIETWLSDPKPQFPIRSLIGPPGTGKSWVLARLMDKNDSLYGKLHLIARDLIDNEYREQIKRHLIRAARQCCPDLGYPEDFLPTLEAIIENLSERMRQKCDSRFVLIMVDGCDDLHTAEEFDRLQVVLARFFSERTNCFRMLIARRSRLTHYQLRKCDLPIQVNVFRSPDGPDSPQEQKRKLLLQAGEEPDTIDLDAILPEGHHYQWNHPFINCYLLTRHLAGAPLTSNSLRTCCLALANRPVGPSDEPERHPELDNGSLDLLIKLATTLPEHWHAHQFKEIAKRDLHVIDLRRGAIVNVRDEQGDMTPKYSIADGLRDLLKDISKMQQMETKL